ncbi:MAG: hypothetical protein HQK63_06215 [Desulfamplus sp.]|nr:hypothetical protein [Desulfamplus sp.]
MHRGYIKIWRKIEDADIIKNHKLCSFWLWCLVKASHKEKTIMVGYQEVVLQAGQFIFGRNKAMQETNLTTQEVRTCLKNLKKQKKITIKPTNKFSIITIMNWDTYQQDNTTTNQQSNQPLTNKEPTTNQQLTTNKNEKNDKNEKNEKNKEKINKKENPTHAELKAYLESKVASLPLSVFKNKILDFFDYRKTIRKSPYKTTLAVDGLIKDLNGCLNMGMDLIFCIDKAMERNWLTPDHTYFKNNNKNNGVKNNAILKPTFTGNDTRPSVWECPEPEWAKD